MALSIDGKNLLLQILNTKTELRLAIYDNQGTPQDIDTKPVTFSSPLSGKINISSNVVFNIGANKTVTRIDLYETTLSNVFASVSITNEFFATAGTYTLTKFEITLT
jgi:hypothetical protein